MAQLDKLVDRLQHGQEIILESNKTPLLKTDSGVKTMLNQQLSSQQLIALLQERDGNYHVMHGIICPSFQAKTRFAYMKAPMAVNSVGGTYVKIDADGTFGLPKFVIQTTKDL